MLYVIEVGLLAGIVMSLAGILLGKIHKTKVDLTSYVGCLLMGSSAKPKTIMIAGLLFHLFMSAFFAVVYAMVITHLAFNHLIIVEPNLFDGVVFGVVHTLFSGTMMLLLDRLNPCVRSKKIAAMGFATIKHGYYAALCYLITHVVYAVIVIRLLA